MRRISISLSLVTGSEGTLGDRDRDLRATASEAREGEDHAVRLRHHRAGVPHGFERDRRRHRARGHGDHGPHTTELVESWLHLGLPLEAGAVLLIEVDGPAASLDAQARPHHRAGARRGHRFGARGEGRSRARRAVEGPQVGVRRVRAFGERLLHHGWRGAAHATGRGADQYLSAVRRARARSRQCVPRRRRQSAPARAVRRRRPGRAGARARGLARDPAHVHPHGRHDLGRARRRNREALDDERAVRSRRSGGDVAAARRAESRSPLEPVQDHPRRRGLRRGCARRGAAHAARARAPGNPRSSAACGRRSARRARGSERDSQPGCGPRAGARR